MHGLETVAPDATCGNGWPRSACKALDSPIIDLTMAATARATRTCSRSCSNRRHATRCSPSSARRRSSIRNSRSSRSCARQGRRNRWPCFSRPTPSARSRCSRRAASLRSARPRPAPTRSPLFSPGARRVAPRIRPRSRRAPNGPADYRAEGRLDEAQALALFSALGHADRSSPPSPVSRATSIALAYPVAAKILSPDIAHKTEAGAVALRHHEPQRVRCASARIARLGCSRATCRAHRRDHRAANGSRARRGHRRLSA